MGYKLAGCKVLGGVEIDPKMMAMYRLNHKPELSYLMGAQVFAKLPQEEIDARLFDLDILDGSPPCSSFSMAGARDRKWGTASKFREGQAEQVLDDLFFHFIEIARRLRPKVVIAENVKGLIIGKAKGYVKQIFQCFNLAGYDVQLFLLDASRMGVPQARERTFFIARRRDLGWKPLVLSFNERPITVGEALKGASTIGAGGMTKEREVLWTACRIGDDLGTVHPRGSWFSKIKLDPHRPSPTVTANSGDDLFHWSEPRGISKEEVVRLQTFPSDYDFNKNKPHYVCGMSVPPFMMQRVAEQVISQWLRREVSDVE